VTVQASHNDLQADIRALSNRFEKAEAERAAYREDTARTLRAMADSLRVTGEALEAIETKLGEEPDSDGNGGRGLIGDVRRSARHIQDLMGLQKVGKGVFATVGVFFTVFGGLIVLGVGKWIVDLVGGR
jgi:hypothetical protein